jgi:hypothetical protein
MLWDPCGHIVVWGRRPYTTTARPFRDSTETREVDWYITRDDAPALPYSSALNSLDDQETRLWYEDQWHNEDPRADRIYNGQGPFPCAGAGHVCGTRDDFEQGGLFPGSAPAPPVDINGIPLCCNPCIVPQGGGVGGGVLIFAAPPVVPGTDCITATILPLGVPVEFITDGRAGSYWFQGGVTGAGAFHIHGPVLGIAASRTQIGGVCPWFLGVLFPASWGPTCEGYFNGSAGPGIWLTFDLTGSGAVHTLTLDAGPC